MDIYFSRIYIQSLIFSVIAIYPFVDVTTIGDITWIHKNLQRYVKIFRKS